MAKTIFLRCLRKVPCYAVYLFVTYDARMLTIALQDTKTYAKVYPAVLGNLVKHYFPSTTMKVYRRW